MVIKLDKRKFFTWPTTPQPDKQEAQLMLANLRNGFRGQSRPPNMAPFGMPGMVSC